MNKKIFNFFEIAAKIAVSKEDCRSFLLGAIAIRNDGAMVKALNSPTEYKNRMVHAECKLCRKIDHNAEVYVARVRLIDYKFGMAKPCFACQKILKTKKVNKVYYTINQTHYGIWFPQKNLDKICEF